MERIFSARNLVLLLALATFIAYFFNRQKAFSILLNANAYLLEMLSGLPAIRILIGLFQVWVPRKTVEKAMGNSSGLNGILMAILVGTAAMGPL